MLNLWGINAAPHIDPSLLPTILRPGGWVRVVIDPKNPLLPEWSKLVWEMGYTQVGVLARESFGGRWSHARVRKTLKWAQDQTYVTAYQIGNEPDIRSPSSWTQTPLGWTRLAQTVLRYLPARFAVLGPGLAGGPERSSQWWSAVPPLIRARLTGVAVHLYGTWPTGDPVMGTWGFGKFDLGWAESFGSPVFVTEWGAPSHELKDLWPAYIKEMTRALEGQRAIHFCLSDHMVPGYGLHDGTKWKLG